MGFINYRDIDWDDLGTEKEQSEIAKSEARGLVIFIVIALGISFMFESVRNILLTDPELLAKYTRTYEWLNRCDPECEKLVNVSLLDLQYNCKGLTNWYYEEGRRDIYSWQLAIDDRATFLGCPGFPKEIEQIKEDTQEREQKIEQQIEETRIEREVAQAKLESEKKQRFFMSLKSSGLGRYVVDVQYEEGSNSIDIVVSSAWDDIQIKLRRQYAQSMWQKWASYNTPTNPSSSRIRILNQIGDLIGGSPTLSATPIWIEE